MPAMSHQPLHLLDLPIEILTHILHPLLTTTTTHPAPAPIPLCTCSPAPLACPSAILPILLTHPRLHAIATPLLYSPEHEFLLDLAGRHHARARREFEDPLLRRGSLLGCRDALRRVGRLSLRIDRLRGWMGERVVPVVADMILRGQLQQLDVFLATGRGLRFEADRLAPGSPLAGIVSLLADPYLRCARMFIETCHGPEWCRFHQGECDHGGGTETVEVSWGSMIPEAGEHFPVARAIYDKRTGV